MATESFDAKGLASQLFQQIRIEPTATSHVPIEKKNRVSDELVYLSLFLIDLSVYLVFGDTDRRQQTMNAFWDIIRNSGLNADALNQRLHAYAEAAKAGSVEASLTKLGETLAWHCLALNDPDFIAIGVEESQSILEQMTAIASSYKD